MISIGRLLTQRCSAKSSGNTGDLIRSLASNAAEGPELTRTRVEGQSAQEGLTSRELDLNYRQGSDCWLPMKAVRARMPTLLSHNIGVLLKEYGQPRPGNRKVHASFAAQGILCLQYVPVCFELH